MIYILTGPIQTGKSSRLAEWVAQQPPGEVAGLLQPIIEGKRYVRNVASGETRPLEADDGVPKSDHLPVGRFVFRESTFRWARSVLAEAGPRQAATLSARWLIVDEIGKLELAGRGLAPVCDALVAHYQTAPPDRHLVLAIRDTLLDAAVARYNLRDYALFQF